MLYAPHCSVSSGKGKVCLFNLRSGDGDPRLSTKPSEMQPAGCRASEKQMDWLLPSPEVPWGLTCRVSHPPHGGQRDPPSPQNQVKGVSRTSPRTGQGERNRGEEGDHSGGHIDTKGRGPIWATLVQHEDWRVFRLRNKPPQLSSSLCVVVMTLGIRPSEGC